MMILFFSTSAVQKEIINDWKTNIYNVVKHNGSGSTACRELTITANGNMQKSFPANVVKSSLDAPTDV